MVFHPICGTFTEVEKRFTATSNIPNPLVFPSSSLRHINCIPKQIPNTGWFSFVITSSKPASLSFFIAELASPTPGNIILSAAFISSASLDKTAVTPNLSKAN